MEAAAFWGCSSSRRAAFSLISLSSCMSSKTKQLPALACCRMPDMGPRLPLVRKAGPKPLLHMILPKLLALHVKLGCRSSCRAAPNLYASPASGLASSTRQ